MENTLTTMPWADITKIFVAVLTIIGSPIIAFIVNNRKDDRKITAYEKLSKALNDKNHNKLEVSEYFRMATGIRMSYLDIKKLVDDDNSIWIIGLLKRMPGYVSYEDGIFKHTKRFSGQWYLPWIQKFTKYFYISGKYFFGGGYILFSYGLIHFNITNNISVGWSIFFIIMIFFSAFGFISLRNMQENDEKVDELITEYKEENLENKNKE